jgi:hypothetical protein
MGLLFITNFIQIKRRCEMNSRDKEIIMGIISVALLLIYFFLLGKLILAVNSWDTQSGVFTVNSDTIWAINIIGGLISAVVIGNLAMAERGETPDIQVLEMIKAYGAGLMRNIVLAYIAIWFLIGAAAFYVGVVRCPDVFEPLNTMGKSWLGILVGALYAWFGIKKT